MFSVLLEFMTAHVSGDSSTSFPSFWHWSGDAGVLVVLVATVWALMLFYFGTCSAFLISRKYQLKPTASTATTTSTATNTSTTSMTKQDVIPGVTILRPLKGLDFELEENLNCLLRQTYPLYEVIFCLEERSDAASEIALKVAQAYPDRVRVLFNDDCEPEEVEEEVEDQRVNPKIENMLKGYRLAKHPIIWVCDANIHFPDPETLTRAVANLQKPNVGMVHYAPVAIHSTTFGSFLEQMFLDTVHTRMYCAINWWGVFSCVNGKSNLWWKKDVELCGGLVHFAKCLAEDNVIGEFLLNKLKKRHVLSDEPAWQLMGPTKVGDYFTRRIRWTRIRKYCVTAATVVEPLTECFVCGLYGVWALSYLLSLTMAQSLMVYAAHVLVWMLCDMWVFTTMMRLRRGHPAPDSIYSTNKITVQWVMTWLIRELTALPIWIIAICGNHIFWRGRWFRLLSNGSAVPASSSSSS